MNNLTLRIGTALFGVSVIVGSIFVHPWMFVSVFTLIALLTHVEFIKTSGQSIPSASPWRLVLPLLFGLIVIFSINPPFHQLAEMMYYVPISILPIVMIIALYQKQEDPFRHIALFILGILYIPVAFGLYMAISDNGNHQWYALGLLCLVWSSDTFAYFAGRWFGKHKLFERISPKKTWEGFFGGLLMTILTGFVLSRFYDALTPLEWIGLATVVCISGAFGDLVESLLKRSSDIKDSGSLLPGHGGFLDRFDAFLLAVPCSVVYLKLVM